MPDPGQLLTEAHRQAQLRIGAAATRDLISAWRILDADRLDRSVPAWRRTAAAVVEQRRRQSAAVAARYLTLVRAADLPDAPPGPPPADPGVDPDAVATSLDVTGPVAVRQRLAAGLPLEQALALSRVGQARAGARHVLNGGRDTVLAAVGDDDRALGYARATSGHCCAFCALLASRGAVYRSEQTAGFRPHDGCSCQPRPVYRADQTLPIGSDRARDVYAAATAGLHGADAVRAFRRAWEGATTTTAARAAG